jgi:CxxC-x17-CxxC domain-containing protein
MSMSLTDAEIQGRYPIKCSDCGKTDSVPFKPDPSRPVYCRVCHKRRRDFAKGESRILRATSRVVVYDRNWPDKEGMSKQ